jgi:hypothetical protein
VSIHWHVVSRSQLRPVYVTLVSFWPLGVLSGIALGASESEAPRFVLQVASASCCGVLVRAHGTGSSDGSESPWSESSGRRLPGWHRGCWTRAAWPPRRKGRARLRIAAAPARCRDRRRHRGLSGACLAAAAGPEAGPAGWPAQCQRLRTRPREIPARRSLSAAQCQPAASGSHRSCGLGRSKLRVAGSSESKPQHRQLEAGFRL